MKKLHFLLIFIPAIANAQQELSLKIGGAFCSNPRHDDDYDYPDNKKTIVPVCQLGYFRQFGKHYQVGLSAGLTSYRRSNVLMIDHGSTYVDVKAYYRYAQTAVPVLIEGRYTLPLKHAELNAGIGVGAAICIASEGPWKPNGSTSYNSDPVTVSYNNTVALNAGVSLGYMYQPGKHFRFGIMPGAQLIYGKFKIAGSGYSVGQSHFFDFKCPIVGAYRF